MDATMKMVWRDMLARSFAPHQWFMQDWDRNSDGTPEPEDKIMWVYRQVSGNYHVGFYTPDGSWTLDGVYDSKEEAVERVHYLNGGN